MRAEDRVLARKQLDKRLTPLRGSQSLIRPPHGWVKAIREALGMTGKQLGKRLGVSQPRATRIEQAELDGSITLDSLSRAARALDCELVYALVPRAPLEELTYERARHHAAVMFERTSHSMALEGQLPDAATNEEQRDHLTEELARKSPSLLWEDE